MIRPTVEHGTPLRVPLSRFLKSAPISPSILSNVELKGMPVFVAVVLVVSSVENTM
jgi:hypothetical protein